MATAAPVRDTTSAVVRREQSALQALDAEIEKRRSALEQSAASLIDPVRLKTVVLTAFTRTPALWECDPISIARSVVESAQYGLEPTGGIGGAHLVPFRNTKTGRMEAQLIIDYRGYIRLARRSGDVSKVWARTVRERDEFIVEAGSDDRIVHRPYIGTEDPGPFTHVYAVLQYRDGTQQFDWDTWAWVGTIRKRSKARDNGPWVTDEAEMAKKSILRRLLKTAPLTVEARQAIEMEEQAEADVAMQRSGRPSSAIVAIRERLGVPTPTAQVEEGDWGEPDEAPGRPVPEAQAAAEPSPSSSGSAAATTSAGSDGPAGSSAEAGLTLAQPPAETDLCGVGSPYGDALEVCVKEEGHTGNHRGSDKTSW